MSFGNSRPRIIDDARRFHSPAKMFPGRLSASVVALATELSKLAVARHGRCRVVESLPHLRKLVRGPRQARSPKRRTSCVSARCAPPPHVPAPDRAAFSRTSPADVISARRFRFPARLVPLPNRLVSLPEDRRQQQDPLSAGRAKIWCRQLHEGARVKVPCPVLETNFFVPRVANAYELHPSSLNSRTFNISHLLGQLSGIFYLVRRVVKPNDMQGELPSENQNLQTDFANDYFDQNISLLHIPLGFFLLL